MNSKEASNVYQNKKNRKRKKRREGRRRMKGREEERMERRSECLMLVTPKQGLILAGIASFLRLQQWTTKNWGQ